MQALDVLCASGQSEGDRHDFKAGLPDTKGATKLCCAFANTFGGFLIIGVNESARRFKIEGIEPDRELYGHLVAKVKADPEIAILPPKTIAIPGSTRLVYVFCIPQSSRRPHLPTAPDGRIFWKRLGSSCVQMTLEEIRYQMNVYEEKREKLALLLMELQHILRSLGEQADMPDGAYNGSIFTFDIIDRVIVESYSIIKEDSNIIGSLDTIKKRLMTVNSEKHKLINMMALNYDLTQKRVFTNNYRDYVRQSIPGTHVLSEQIERSLKEKFGIDNPYRGG